MSRFDATHYDYRGPDFDRRCGRFETAFARRVALERARLERLRRRLRRRPPRLPEDFLDQLRPEDYGYGRRYWPPSDAPRHRMD